MNSKIRQFENAVDLLIKGVLFEDDNQQVIRSIIAALERVIDDWKENLLQEFPTIESLGERLDVDTREAIARYQKGMEWLGEARQAGPDAVAAWVWEALVSVGVDSEIMQEVSAD